VLSKGAKLTSKDKQRPDVWCCSGAGAVAVLNKPNQMDKQRFGLVFGALFSAKQKCKQFASSKNY